MFLFLILFTQAQNWNSLPKGVHQWAQADRYAIAARYTEERNFFSPATYSIISDRGEVGVELPLIQYISGTLAATPWTRPYLPFFYRVLTFLLLVFGAYRLILRHASHFPPWQRLLIGLVLLTAPIHLFYGYNFSPDAAALGCILMGLSFLDTRLSRFYVVLFWLGMATFLKTSAGIYLLAFLGTYAFFVFPKAAGESRKWIGKLGASVLLLGSIAAYIKFLIMDRNAVLWSTLFLSQTHPLDSLDTAKATLNVMWRWRMEYFTLAQWLLTIAGVVIGIRFLRNGKIHRSWQGFIMLVLMGQIAILYLFGTQFMHHDYYFIATFSPLLLWVLLLACTKMDMRWGGVLLAVVAIWSFTEGSNQHFDRNSSDCEIKGEYHTFDYAWLQQLKQDIENDSGGIIDPEEKVFVVYELEPNLALSYMDRLGIVFNQEEMGRQESNFYYWLERRTPDYVLCRNQNLELFKEQHGLFLKRCSIAKETTDYTLFEIHGY